MKELHKKMMMLTSSAAMLIAFFTLSTTCRLWLYQPTVPKKLQEMDA